MRAQWRERRSAFVLGSLLVRRDAGARCGAGRKEVKHLLLTSPLPPGRAGRCKAEGARWRPSTGKSMLTLKGGLPWQACGVDDAVITGS